MIDIIGMSFIPLYKVVGPFLLCVSMLMMVWVGSRLTVKICLRVAIYKVLWVWSLGVHCFLGDVVSASSLPFYWINRVMEDVGERVGHMLSPAAS
jgi:hypothetical protein